MAKIHQRGNLYALVSCRKPEIVYGVMWNSERVKIDLADSEVSTRFYLLQPIAKRLGTFSRLIIAHVEALANVGIMSFRGNIDWTINRPEQYAQPARMVAMFMRYQHGIKLPNVFTDERESARNLLRAESSVNQNASLAGNDQNCIAR